MFFQLLFCRAALNLSILTIIIDSRNSSYYGNTHAHLIMFVFYTYEPYRLRYSFFMQVETIKHFVDSIIIMHNLCLTVNQ